MSKEQMLNNECMENISGGNEGSAKLGDGFRYYIKYRDKHGETKVEYSRPKIITKEKLRDEMFTRIGQLEKEGCTIIETSIDRV